MRQITLILFFITYILQSAQSLAEENGSITIVLDDLGYSPNDFSALSLPKEITFSILPFTPQAKKLAKMANQQGRDILLHIPMQAKSNNDKLGKGALMLDMQEDEFKNKLQQSLHYLPYAQGINNHMGSSLTEQLEPMRWTMEVLKKQGLYFLDSRTTAQTIAQSTALIEGVAALRRHVFLDNIKTQHAMYKQLQHAVKLSKENKAVVIIAHPYPETLYFLKQLFGKEPNNFKLTALNQLIPKTERLAMLKKKSEYRQARLLIKTNNSTQ